jgi:hypothetical protein
MWDIQSRERARTEATTAETAETVRAA